MESSSSFSSRALQVAGLVAGLAFVTWLLAAAGQMILLAFAALLLAVLLTWPTDWMCARFGLRRSVSVGVVLAVAGLLLAGILTFLGATLVSQVHTFADRLPALAEKARTWAEGLPLVGEQVRASGGVAEMAPSGEDAAKRIAQVVSAVFSTLGGFLALLFIGAFVAVDPTMYRRGLLRLLPIERRPRVEHALTLMGVDLKHWLKGTAIAMIADGVATGLGLWAIGIDQALLLGLLAGLLAFIPNIGAFLAVAPAIAIAAADGPEKVAMVVGLFVVVQTLEGNVLTPLLHAKGGELPPALQLVAQLVFATVAGTLGLALSTPLLVVVLVAVKVFYIEDVLGDVEEAPPPVA